MNGRTLLAVLLLAVGCDTCVDITTKNPCKAASCEWDKTAKKCYGCPSVPTDQCEAIGCLLVLNNCVDKCKGVPDSSGCVGSGCMWDGSCGDCESISESSDCNQHAGCEFYNSACKPKCDTLANVACLARGCSWNANICTHNAGTSSGCTNHLDQAACIDNACTWDTSCRETTCTDYADAMKCQQAACNWEGNQCIEASGCTTHQDASLCTDNECIWDNSCRDAECGDLVMQETCEDKSGCQWSGTECSPNTDSGNSGQEGCAQYDESVICVQNGCLWESESCIPPDCQQITTIDLCNDASGCQWGQQGCEKKPPPPEDTECEKSENEQDCTQTTGCMWMDEECKTYVQCPGHLKGMDCTNREGCQYDGVACAPRSDQCGTREGEQACNDDNLCFWDDSNQQCQNPPACNTFENDEDCHKYNCQWDFNDLTCQAIQIRCYEYANEYACNNRDVCLWVGTTCSKVCTARPDTHQCDTDGQCSWTGSSCVAKENDACRPLDTNACEAAADCIWSAVLGCNYNNTVPETTSQSCGTFENPVQCNENALCEYDGDDSECEYKYEENECPTLAKQKCLEEADENECLWVEAENKCKPAPKSCDTYVVQGSCDSEVGRCFWSSSDSRCFSTCANLKEQTACVAAGCLFSKDALPQCNSFDSGGCASAEYAINKVACLGAPESLKCTWEDDDKKCIRFGWAVCGFENGRQQACFDHKDSTGKQGCGYNNTDATCIGCEEQEEAGCKVLIGCSWESSNGKCDKDTSPFVSSMSLSVTVPAPKAPFRATFSGGNLNRELSRVIFIKNTTTCPTSYEAHTISFVGASGDGIVSDDITIDAPGTYKPCFVQSQTELSVRGQDSLPEITVKMVHANSLYLSYEGSPGKGEMFTFFISGENMKEHDRFAFVPTSQDCPTNYVKYYTGFETVGSQLATGKVTLQALDTFRVCYLSGVTVDANTRHLVYGQVLVLELKTTPLTITTVAGFLDPEILGNRTELLVQTLGIDLKVINELCTRGQPTGATRDVEEFHWGPTIGWNEATREFGIGEEVTRYAQEQVCVMPIVPEMSNSDSLYEDEKPNHFVLAFTEFNVDESDEVRVFASKAAIGDSTELADEVGPTLSTLSECPTSIEGLKLIGSYNGNNIPTQEIKVKFGKLYGFVIPKVIVAFCSDKTDRGGTGFRTIARIDPPCPNRCQDPSGRVLGECVLDNTKFKGRCKCISGWTGIDCRVPEVCSGSKDEVDSISRPSGSLTTSLESPLPCGFKLAPNPLEDPSLLRFTTYQIVLRIRNESVLHGGAVAIYDTSHNGVLLTTIDAASLGVNHTIVVDASAVYLEVNTLTTGTFSFDYKLISTVCPGPLGVSGVPSPDEECDGRGECVDVEWGTLYNEAPRYLKKCECTEEYAARKAQDSCNICAHGYSLSNGSCVTSVACKVLDDCGGEENAEECVTEGVRGCLCTNNHFGRNCEYTLPANLTSVLETDEQSTDLMFRYDFNKRGANLVRSQNYPDRTQLGCVTSLTAPCIYEDREKGNVYTYDTRRTGGSKDVDDALYLNKQGDPYDDILYIDQLAASKLDVHGDLTITAWVKATNVTDGLLVAKADNIFYKNGKSPVLEEVLSNMRSDTADTENPGVRAYFAIYLDGSDGSVKLHISKKDNTSNSQFVRKFRAGSMLFDDNWHFFALTIGRSGGRWEGQLFIDGKTSTSDATFVQCIPFVSTEVETEPLITQAYDAEKYHGQPNLEMGGVLVVGYNLSAAVDEVRLYDAKLTHFTVVSIGSKSLFEDELSLAVVVLLSVGITAILPLSVSLGFPMYRSLRRSRKAEKVTPLPATRLILSRPSTARTQNSQGSGGGEGNGGTRTPSETPSETPRDSQTPGEEGILLETNTASRVKSKIAALGHAVAVQNASGVDGTALDQAVQQVGALGSGIAAGGGAGGGGGGGGGGVLDAAHSTGQSLGDIVVLQLTIIRDTWQMVALLLTAWEWPQLFKDIYGKATIPLTVDLTYLSSSVQDAMQGLSAFEWAFYSASSVCFIAFITLMGIIATEEEESLEVRIAKRDVWRDIKQKYMKLEEDTVKEFTDCENDKEAVKLRDEKLKELSLQKAKEIEGEGLARNIRDKMAFVSLLLVSTLYLPITRGAVMVLRCHRDVQCIWDCATITDTDNSYVTAFVISSAVLIVLSLLCPAYLALVIRKKKKEFDAMYPTDRDANWVTFTSEDRTSYKDVYAGFEYRWVYFQVWIMLFKAVMCVPTLGLEQNGQDQLISSAVIQGLFTLLVFASAPFLLSACDYILQAGQVNIMFSLSISCFYRADPKINSYDYVLLVAGGVTILFQLYQVLFNHSNVVNLSLWSQLEREFSDSNTTHDEEDPHHAYEGSDPHDESKDLEERPSCEQP